MPAMDLKVTFCLQNVGSSCVTCHMRVMLSIVGNPEEYQTFLESRPAVMEEKAIDLVCEMCLKYK